MTDQYQADVRDDTPGPDPVRPIHRAPGVEDRIEHALEVLHAARPMPLSTSVMVNPDELIGLLSEALDGLPDELRSARWLLREREEYLERAQLEADKIIAAATSRSAQLVDRTEIMKSAQQRSQQIISDAEAEARLMRRETEDFCDERLAALEDVLDRTRTVVVTGRNRLQGTNSPIDLREVEQEVPIGEPGGLFDQDMS